MGRTRVEKCSALRSAKWYLRIGNGGGWCEASGVDHGKVGSDARTAPAVIGIVG
jgi:hypothetical protein